MTTAKFIVDVSDKIKAAEERLPPEARDALEWHRKRGRQISGQRMAIREEQKQVRADRDDNEIRYGNEERDRTKLGIADEDGEWRAPYENARKDHRRRLEELNNSVMALPADHSEAIEEWLAAQ